MGVIAIAMKQCSQPEPQKSNITDDPSSVLIQQQEPSMESKNLPQNYQTSQHERENNDISTGTLNLTKYCAICKNSIGENCIERKCCKPDKSSYHEDCLITFISNQILTKNNHVLKCKCGTIMKTQVLRNSQLLKKMSLLAQLFDNQIEILMKGQVFRHDEELKQYIEKHRIAKQEADYILINQECLLYSETPQ